MEDYGYDGFDAHHHHAAGAEQNEPSSNPVFVSQQEPVVDEVDFDDPEIAALPRILLMGPRRGGKTSIQVRIFM
jgi:hypothetical protein